MRKRGIPGPVFHIICVLSCLSQESPAGTILQVYDSFLPLCCWDFDCNRHTNCNPPHTHIMVERGSTVLLSQRDKDKKKIHAEYRSVLYNLNSSANLYPTFKYIHIYIYIKPDHLNMELRVHLRVGEETVIYLWLKHTHWSFFLKMGTTTPVHCHSNGTAPPPLSNFPMVC